MQNDPEKVLKHIKLYGEDSMEASWLREHAGKDLVVETIEGKTRTKIQSTHDKVDSIKGVNPKTRITPEQPTNGLRRSTGKKGCTPYQDLINADG